MATANSWILVLGNTTRPATRYICHSHRPAKYLNITLGEGPPVGDGFIEPSLPREQVRQDAYLLPKDFEWCVMDLNDSKQAWL